MPDDIKVRPAGGGKPVPVRTEVDGVGVHTPIYKTAFGADGDLTLVDEDNPMPISADAALHLTLVSKLDEVVTQLKIMNAYNALGHDEVIKEEDVYED